MRTFNVGGVCDPRKNYMISAAGRLPEVLGLVEQESYFVVHAPRQTGKTTSLRAVARELTASGRYAALHVSCEVGQALGDDYEATELSVLAMVSSAAERDLPQECRPFPGWPVDGPGGTRIVSALSEWARTCPLPIVLVLDEIDALWGKGLESVLRQLRSGHPSRPAHFPSTVILCGMRNVRDYKLASGGSPLRIGSASPFNILVEAITLKNFTEAEVQSLYLQHTEETGRRFSADVFSRVMEQTGGQPWLVNALAREIVEKMSLPEGEEVVPGHVEQARERLILARATHLDSLAARLGEERVRRILEPVLAGTLAAGETYDDDYQYVRDLGLVADTQPVQIANPIYREVIARVLALAAGGSIVVEPRSFIRPDGSLDTQRILQEFSEFWKENGDILASRMPWQEVAAQLVLMAWLQRVVNGGGVVDREYGIGRGRIDLLLRWPYRGPQGGRLWQKEAFELKVWAPGRPDPLAKGLVQLDEYLVKSGLDLGYLVLFDRRPDAAPIEERTLFSRARTASGREVVVLRA